jgi:hypothetical protein
MAGQHRRARSRSALRLVPFDQSRLVPIAAFQVEHCDGAAGGHGFGAWHIDLEIRSTVLIECPARALIAPASNAELAEEHDADAMAMRSCQWLPRYRANPCTGGEFGADLVLPSCRLAALGSILRLSSARHCARVRESGIRLHSRAPVRLDEEASPLPAAFFVVFRGGFSEDSSVAEHGHRMACHAASASSRIGGTLLGQLPPIAEAVGILPKQSQPFTRKIWCRLQDSNL